ncbi:MAG: hypothetical protein WCG81_22140 [Candidatus Angelobacter sp.]
MRLFLQSDQQQRTWGPRGVSNCARPHELQADEPNGFGPVLTPWAQWLDLKAVIDFRKNHRTINVQ